MTLLRCLSVSSRLTHASQALLDACGGIFISRKFTAT